jgi:RES domain-containing protein
LPRAIHEVRVSEIAVLDLRGDRLGDVGLEARDVRSDDWSACQLVGQAAHFLGAAGLVAESATNEGLTIAVFETRVHGQLEVVQVGEIDPSDLVESDPDV